MEIRKYPEIHKASEIYKACSRDGCSCGLLFVERQDALGKVMRDVTGSNYTSGGFYCYSSIPPHHMILVADPLGNISRLNSFEELIRDPTVSKICVRYLRDRNMIKAFHQSISNIMSEKINDKELLYRMFDDGIPSTIMGRVISDMRLTPSRHPTLPNRQLDPLTMRTGNIRGLRSDSQDLMNLFDNEVIIYETDAEITSTDDLTTLLIRELMNPSFRERLDQKFRK